MNRTEIVKYLTPRNVLRWSAVAFLLFLQIFVAIVLITVFVDWNV